MQKQHAAVAGPSKKDKVAATASKKQADDDEDEESGKCLLLHLIDRIISLGNTFF
jgi:hypothetical protein